MKHEIKNVKTGLTFVFFGLLFGLGLGVLFGVYEDNFKDFIELGVLANPELHDEQSQGKIWTYAKRAHLHSMGIVAVSLGLILLIMVTSMRSTMKSLTAIPML